MKAYNISKHSSFYVVGLSYKKADVHTRGIFSLNEESRTNLLRQAKSSGIDGILVTSTCNRTELFGFAQHPFQLIQLLCGNTQGTVEEFQKVGYVYKNYEAINHMFRVGTGLDSQILGDFEIISQIKQGFYASREEDMTNHFLERLCNSVIQASKRIKNETELSSGATSVAFASVQYILSKVPNISEKNILLFGTGKIGRNTCENLVKHTDNDHIVLINRTRDKAEKVAGKFNLLVKEYGELQEEIRKADVLVVATGAQHPTVSGDLIHTSKPLLVLDLSIPRNVDDNVGNLENVTLVHLDQLSKMTDDTLKRREKYIPKAEAIISEVEGDFKKWLETRKFAPTIKALKKKLKSIQEAEIDNQRKKIKDFNDEHAEILSDRIIQKITTHFANHLRESPNSSDESIELIKKVFQLETSK
ncbi:glutamyl-tRNA reductase [Robertkochia marina]|uniref:Glutamyl-tRNA reductase n=1 Tax=Robertkochia marina TaxID=1227945 RepID=A0A4S3M3E9_9FLAO|nr:glutamyl-tRNA reductase [Robertkochia marina]THD69420.1 glutamyl-tRNA reductase [Robertkochia marina]TRZ47319.1 glutamyl-tRNA reductase [Robertkochia marina]